MKILIVADGGNIHTKRWAAALADAGVETVVFSLTPAETGFYSGKGVILHVFDLFSYKQGGKKPFLKAIARHSKAVRELKRLIKKEKPDIVHAHYATSYGLVAALAGFHPLIISVWGSDVYEFPKQSKIN